MKNRKRDFQIFNLSFLDIISCGFGAVVLLVLISNTQPGAPDVSGPASHVVLEEVLKLKQQVRELERETSSLIKVRERVEISQTQMQQRREELESLRQSLENQLRELGADLDGLALVQSSLEQAKIRAASNQSERDEEVGGIPVDSDYVIFVIDTSGSMLQIWPRVAREIENVLAIHPEVKGFQILNDQGQTLISGYRGRWIPDNPRLRKNVMAIFGKWNDASNSSPVEGIETALKVYARKVSSAAIYVFGDDYSGGSYDPVLARITKMNRDSQGRRIAKIHSIGFISQGTTNRYAVLMRALSEQNGGSFLALPVN